MNFTDQMAMALKEKNAGTVKIGDQADGALRANIFAAYERPIIWPERKK
jgi:hypothetical protein